jgi:hypothetical protein
MKVLFVLLISILVSLYKAEKCDSDAKPKEASDCHNLDKSVDNQYKCCYVYEKYFLMGSLEKGKLCHPVTQIEFNNIKDVIKSYKDAIEKMGGILDTYNIDCSSNYLFISLLLLMILLL